MKIILSSLLLVFAFISSFGQGCFEIESILVDACGTPEGQNEMVRLRIGSNPLNTADIVVNWPNNPFQGICQNANSASHVAYMNSTIQSCGYFLEPTGGVLPAGAQVLFITSTDFDPTSHNYAGLTDTIYVIFQCAGNTNGHFANWANPCDPATGNRTLIIDIGLCNETVTYNRCDLINQTGGIGGTAAERDGARVDFDNAGNATYANDGCTIPYVLSTLSAQFSSGNGVVCIGDQQSVTATTNGNFSSVFWLSVNGVFDNNQSLTTNYTPTTNQSHYIYFNGVNGCNDTISDSLFIDILLPPNVAIQENILSNDCTPGSIELIASGADTYAWNSGETSSTIAPGQSGQFIVIGTNECGTDADTIQVIFGSPPICSIDLGDTYFACVGDTVVVAAITNSGSIVWNTGEITPSINITETGIYSFTNTSNCGACSDSIFVQFTSLSAYFTVNIEQGGLEEVFNFTNLTVGANQFAWFLDGQYINNSQDFNVQFSEEGQYTITLEATDAATGCSGSYSIVLTVIDDFEIKIPNIFTPNEDSSNETFGIWINKELRMNAFILNRWGNVMEKTNTETNSTGFTTIWNGFVDGEPATEGVYFYKIIIYLPKGPAEYHGHFQLVR
jgi:gliding motility-associated-like protein